MTIYYVSTTGSDSNNGLSAATPFRTLGKVITVEAAGDTVYIAPGWYREVNTLTASGSSGSLITWIGDVQGTRTLSTPGRIFIVNRIKTGTQFENSLSPTLAITDTSFRRFECLNVLGGLTTAVIASGSAATAYEQMQFYGCAFHTGSIGDNNARSVFVQFNEGATPATSGMLFDNCTFGGWCDLRYKSQTSSDKNLKTQFNRCVFIGSNFNVSSIAVTRTGSATSPNYVASGIVVQNCLFMGGMYGIDLSFSYWNATTVGVIVQNSVIYGVDGITVLYGYNGANNVTRNNYYANSNSSSNYFTFYGVTGQPEYFLEGVFDSLVVTKLLNDAGIRVNPYASVFPPDVTSWGGPGYNPTGITENEDLFGENHTYKVRILRALTGSHNGTAWASGSYENSVIDQSYGSNTVSTVGGSESSNWVQVDSFDSFGAFDPGAISAVSVRFYNRSHTANYTIGYKVYTSDLGETLASGTYTVPLHATDSSARHINEVALTPPSAGWNSTNTPAIKVRFWRTAGQAYMCAIDLAVVCANGGNMIGPVSPVTQGKAVKQAAAISGKSGIVVGPATVGPINAYSPSPGILDLNDDNNSLAGGIVFPKTGTVTHVGFYVTRVVGSPPPYTVGLVTQASNATSPTETAYGGSTPATPTVSASGWNWIELSASASVQVGDLAFARIWPVSGNVPNSSNYISVVSDPVIRAGQTGVLYYGWNVNAGLAPVAVRYNDGTIEGLALSTNVIGINIHKDSTPDEVGCKFIPSATMVVDGVYFMLGTTSAIANLSVVVYDASDNVLASNTFASYETSATSPKFARFSPITLQSSSVYRVVIKPTTGSSGAMYIQRLKFDSMAALAAWPIGNGLWQYTSRVDAGPWTDEPDTYAFVGLNVVNMSFSEVAVATIERFYPSAAEIFGTDKADYDVTATNRPVLAFDASSNEYTEWTTSVPYRALGTTIDCEVFFTMASATSGNLKFLVAVEAVRSGDSVNINTTDGFDTANAVTIAVPAVAGYPGKATVTLAYRDSMIEGDLVRLRITRDTSVASNASGDAYVFMVTLKNS